MRRWALWTSVAALFWLAGCGGGSSSSTAAATVTVIISPSATQTVTQGGSVTFTATVNSTDPTTGVVTNITSTGVTWQVDGTTGGAAATTGAISTTGVYTAPATVTAPLSITITAVSVQDTSASTSATVNVEPQPNITISPTTATVPAGQSLTFASTVLSSVTNPAVTWQLTPAGPGGTINQSGTYVAPQVPPIPGGQAVVTAVLTGTNINEQSVTATVTDTYSLASLNCSYAFFIRGQNTHGAFLRAGTFTANGQGALTGVEDINGGGFTDTAVSFTGTYTISADGRGTMVFHDGYGQYFGGTDSTFSLVVVSATQVQLAETDSFATGSGEADFQTCSTPAATAISGEYVFDFSGTDASANPLSIVGEFDSTGACPTGTCLEDSNDNGTLSPSATIAFSSVVGGANGRSTATFTQGTTTTNFAYYMISASQLVFIELDSEPVVGGQAVAQPIQPGGFSSASVGGNCVVTTKGTNSSMPVATVASFSASVGALQAGTLIHNNSGTGATGAAFTGTYTVAANGRGTMSLSSGQTTYTYVFYLSGVNQGVVQETDSSIVGDGPLLSLVSSPPVLSSLSGSFAMQWSGASTSTGEQDATGQFVASSGNFQTGTLDSDTANGASTLLGFQSATTSLTPTSPYSLRLSPGTITITVPNPCATPNMCGSTNLQFAVLFTSQTSAILLRVDTSDSRALSGLLVRQF